MTAKIFNLLSLAGFLIATGSASAEEMTTPLQTVVGFYAALSSGDGKGSQEYLVPEKRGRGNFAPSAISEYYRSFAEPLTLLTATSISVDQVNVHYHYVGPHGPCDGLATVVVRRVGQRFLVDHIKALTGC